MLSLLEIDEVLLGKKSEIFLNCLQVDRMRWTDGCWTKSNQKSSLEPFSIGELKIIISRVTLKSIIHLYIYW